MASPSWGNVWRDDAFALSDSRDMLICVLRGVSRLHLAVFSAIPLVNTMVATQVSDCTLLNRLNLDLYA